MSTEPEHLRPTRTDRGFDHLPPIPSTDGGSVRVYESSAASGPHIWLNVDIAEVMKPVVVDRNSAPVHLTVENAQKFAEQILWLVQHHYQTAAEESA